MCETCSKNEFESARAALAAARSLLVIAHCRPDGDTLGSMLALTSSARAAGKAAHMMVDDDVPAKYDFLFPDERPLRGGALPDLAESVDRIVIVDTAALAQLDSLAPVLARHAGKIVVIDHHTPGERIAAVQWTDTSAAAAGVMVAQLLAALGWPVGLVQAEALMAAVTSDTGWFRFANTNPPALRLAADWLAMGVRLEVLYARLFQTARPQQLALVARMLGTLELFHHDRLAAMTLRQADFAATGARADETENLVNEALRIGSVEAVILLVENGGAQVRVNLRSREAVDVAAVARALGGGGHRRAAGLRSNEPLDALKARLVAACQAALTEAGL
ncbi:MAG: DHHA1 domain-containing protein [Planctomycetota bacterium]|nr:DHHA1 domain-containing protein [Planctomycetota bacterium]